MSRNILFLVRNGMKKLNFHKSGQINKFMSGLSGTRCFAAIPTATNNPTNLNANIESDRFTEVYHKLLADIKKSSGDDALNEANQWFHKAVEYNLPHGKMYRGMTLVEVYSKLNKNQTNSDSSSDMERVIILGWSLEYLQTFFLIYDDIMDSAITRRGKPCWYRNADVGMIAINDTLMLENTCYELVRKHFGNEPYYSNLINLYIDNVRKTIYGQCMDMLSFQRGVSNKPDFAKYTMERYVTIVKYKTSYYSACLPVQLAMHICGVSDSESHAIAERILLKIGEYYQIQDDVLDCFADPTVIGKVGTDIEDGKCCWPVVTALQRANRQQYKVLEDNYGINDSVAVEKVKRVYNELNIENEFKSFAEKSYNEICKDIESIDKSSKLTADIFYSVLNKIHKRQK